MNMSDAAGAVWMDRHRAGRAEDDVVPSLRMNTSAVENWNSFGRRTAWLRFVMKTFHAGHGRTFRGHCAIYPRVYPFRARAPRGDASPHALSNVRSARLAGLGDRLRHVGHGRLDGLRRCGVARVARRARSSSAATSSTPRYAYGDGHSERLLGETLRRHRGQEGSTSPPRCRPRTAVARSRGDAGRATCSPTTTSSR